MRPLAWLVLLALASLVFFGISYYWPSNAGDGGKKFSKKEEKAVQAKIATNNAQIKSDSTKAKNLGKKAQNTEVRLVSMREKAVLLHKKSVSHATPVPTSDTAIVRLQKFFSTFGDKPRPKVSANLH